MIGNRLLIKTKNTMAYTTQELINQAQSEMLDLSSRIRKMDYLTHKESDGEDMSKYGDWRGERKQLRIRYNELEAEVSRLQLLLKEEQEQVVDVNDLV